jgi:hypothetical protein
MTTAIPPTEFTRIIQTNSSPETIAALLNKAERTHSPMRKHWHGNRKYVYPFWKTCEVCSKPFQCQNWKQLRVNKTCSPACMALKIGMENSGKEETGPGLSEVRCVIQADGESSKSSSQISLLRDCMRSESKGGRSGVSQAPEGNISKGEGWLDERFSGLLPCEDERREQSVLEGGSNLLQKARKLHSSKVCSLSGRSSADGEEGRLCDGTSVASGQGFGTPTAEGRGGSPLRPQSQEQCNLQSDVVCLESRPQTVRASRFTRADLARVEPVYYQGIVWCVRVPSGAFVARRNGKVFVTGNSGFPKHKSKLKPAAEEWVLCRNPGPLWLGIDECRLSALPYTQEEWNRMGSIEGKGAVRMGQAASPVTKAAYQNGLIPVPSGRWPANLALSHHSECVCQGTKKVKGSHDAGKSIVTIGTGPFRHGPDVGKGYADADGTETIENWTCHPDCPIRLLDEQAGERRSYCSNKATAEAASGKEFVNKNRAVYELSKSNGKSFVRGQMYADKGGASRFFANFSAEADTSRMLYCPKASKRDRGEGNRHNTVKSTTLMSWLVKLACPEGGLVLDSFAGSGSTGVACLRTGRRFFGVESDRESCLTAARRLRAEE